MQKIDFNISGIPVTEGYDLVIAGGGTAGAIAGISAAREGLKALIVEQLGALGGSQTLGMVNPIMPSFIKDNPSTSGIDKEIHEKMVELGCAVNDQGPRDRFFDPNGFYNPEVLQFVLEDMVTQAGCEILYHTVLIEAITKDSKIECIIVSNKDGISAIKAKRYIDCTGDADLAVMSGVKYESGNDMGINQPVTLKFEMCNIDFEKFEKYLVDSGQREFFSYPTLHVDNFGWAPGFKELVKEKHENGELTDLDVAHLQMFSIPGKPGSIIFNCPELGNGENVISARNLSEKQIEGKRAVRRIETFMKEYVPGFGDAYISKIAPVIGIRESRRIKAEYQFTKEDIFNYRKFDDGVASNNFFLDVHGEEDSKQRDKYIKVTPEDKFYEIPYRSIVPLGIDNLLVAGRCSGFDFYAQSSTRVQRPVRALGEAAGIAAKLSVSDDCAFREVNGKEIRRIMKERGAELR